MQELRKEDSDVSVKRKRAAAVWCVMGALLLGSAAAVWWMKHKETEGGYAYIYQKGELVRRVDLSAVEEPYEIRIESGSRAYNVLEVRQGSIGMVDADCPDRLCVHMGFISNSWMPITCMPNQVVVKVADGESDASDSVDEVSY